MWADDPLDLTYPIGIIADGLFCWHSGTHRTEMAITASDADSSWPASNLLSPLQAVPTRTANATGTKTWVFDFGEPVLLHTMSVYNHNLSSGAIILAQLNASDSWGAPSVSETVTVHPGRLIHVFARPYWYRYARLSVTDAAAAGGYIQLGTCDWWQAFELFGSTYYTRALTDMSGSVETQHGTRIPRTLTTGRDLTLRLEDMKRPHGRRFSEVLLEVGGGASVLVMADPVHYLYASSAYGILSSLPTEKIEDPSWEYVSFSEFGVLGDRP